MQNFWQKSADKSGLAKNRDVKGDKKVQRLTLNFMVGAALMVGAVAPLVSFGEHAFPGLEPAVLWAFQRFDREAPHAQQIRHARQLAQRLQRQFIQLFHLLTPGATNDLTAFRQLARNLPAVLQWAENQHYRALHGSAALRQHSLSPPSSPGTPTDEARGCFCFTDGTPTKSTRDIVKGIYETAGNGGGQGQGQGNGGQGQGGQGQGGQGQANGRMMRVSEG